MQAKGTATLSSSVQQILGHRPATLAGGYVAGIRGLQAPSFGPRYYQLLFTQNAQDFVGGLTRADRMALGVQYERT